MPIVDLPQRVDAPDSIFGELLQNFQIWQSLPVSAMLIDRNGVIVAANSLCQSNFAGENIVGLNDVTLLGKFSSEIAKTSEELNLTREHLLHIHQLVVQNKAFIKALIILPQNDEIRSLIFNYIPIFAKDGEVIAVQKITSEFGFFGLTDYLNLLQNKKPTPLRIMPKDYKMPIKLAKRQHEIIFLLTNGINQSNIARILSVSRTAVAKTIAEVICPKFAISDNNVGLLIDKATAMNYNKFIPPSLCKIGVILFDYQAMESNLEIQLIRVDT
ncbi:MAG: hypothetical protein E6Q33_02975 [Neisseriales bacterium]|nr:MAG: hypothetical protein E6Q33_02975 [Neisseriales bacterium]